MDQNDYLGLVRDLLKVVGGVLVAHGAVTSGNYELISGIAIAAFPIVWSAVNRRQVKAAIVDSAATGKPITVGVTSPVAPQTSTAQQAAAALGPVASKGGGATP